MILQLKALQFLRISLRIRRFCSFEMSEAILRTPGAFRNRITADGSSGFPAEAGRYHLYVAMPCPFAHRALFARKVKGLADVVSVDVFGYQDAEKGWTFSDDPKPPCTIDTVNGCKHILEIYKLVDKDFNGRATVPILWDKKQNTIVSNESSDIMEMFCREFNAFGNTPEQKALDLYPESKRAEIDELKPWIASDIALSVYNAGFSQNQKDYDKNVVIVFKALDRVEEILSTRRFLTGNVMTEADIFLFTPLIRFDRVYHMLFKCNKKMISRDYPNIWGFVRHVYSSQEVRDSVDFPLTLDGYYRKMGVFRKLNTFGIVPIGPELDFDEPHGREKLNELL
ncbi:glutathionyl-hydroquinone reductase YqjG-like [Lineus longissimus]|uniref:glutathionyl-hydroquinone reductase YqjG-like n=1 Tax=Lineus longissimus TaxID=88925 RepID=UPI002B4DCBF9